MHADLLNAWSPENPNSNIPRFQFADSYSAASSDRFLTSASYLTLQNLNLGYTLPSNLCRQWDWKSCVFIWHVTMYGLGRNVRD